MNFGKLLISIFIALLILVTPLSLYKAQISKCQDQNSKQPTVCNLNYIPFQQGFPLKFYHQHCPDFCLYNGKPWFIGQSFPHTDHDYRIKIPWYAFFSIDFIFISTTTYIFTTLVSRWIIKK